jgi:hypothetical protein
MASVCRSGVKTTVHVDDDLASRARLEGLNFSALLRSALRERLDVPDSPMLVAVDGLIDYLELGADVELAPSVELARALARKVDQARVSHSAAMTLALATVSKELRSVLEPLSDHGDEETRAFVAGLFDGVESSALT